MRRLLIAGNWKMNGSLDMTSELISGVAQAVGKNERSYDVLVCPPAPYLAQAANASHRLGAKIAVGAQTVSEHESGAYTGEMSLSMIAELGCSYVLLGHSERREYYSESNQNIADKFKACVDSDTTIVPVLCVGETLQDREAGNTEKVVSMQIQTVLDTVGIEHFENSVIAYEPVWAIGTGKTASPEQAQEVHAFIRDLLKQSSAKVAEGIQILYGGSVKPDNAQELFSQTDIDGGLIGGASLSAESFSGICKAAEKVK